jgi:hypothetical protein
VASSVPLFATFSLFCMRILTPRRAHALRGDVPVCFVVTFGDIWDVPVGRGWSGTGRRVGASVNGRCGAVLGFWEPRDRKWLCHLGLRISWMRRFAKKRLKAPHFRGGPGEGPGWAAVVWLTEGRTRTFGGPWELNCQRAASAPGVAKAGIIPDRNVPIKRRTEWIFQALVIDWEGIGWM